MFFVAIRFGLIPLCCADESTTDETALPADGVHAYFVQGCTQLPGVQLFKNTASGHALDAAVFTIRVCLLHPWILDQIPLGAGLNTSGCMKTSRLPLTCPCTPRQLVAEQDSIYVCTCRQGT